MGDSNAYLIDAPTMAELVLLGAVDALAALPVVYATSETADVLRLKVEELQEKGPEGQLLDDNGQMRFVEFSPQAKERARSQAQAAVDALEKYCQVVPAYGPERRPGFFDHVERILSAEERSVLSAALERNLCLVTTDLRLRQMAAQMKLSGVWPQVLLQFAVSKGVMTARQYSQCVLSLLLSNRSFVPLTPGDVWELCQQSTHWVRFGVARLKVYLAKPTVHFESTFGIVKSFVVLAAVRGMRLGPLAELIRHLTEGVMRHKDATQDTPEELLEAIRLMLTSRWHYPYPPLIEHENRLVRTQFGFLAKAVQEGVSWAVGEPEERPVRLVVHFVTRSPVLMFVPAREASLVGK